MKNYGRAAISDLLGDLVIFRSLSPLDARLPGLNAISEQLDLPPGRVPRKTTPEYARVIAYILNEARGFNAPGAAIKHILMVGDTQLNDGNAFRNVCRAGGWSGLAFIGSEKGETRTASLEEHDAGTLYLANRWDALYDFETFIGERDIHVDETTAVLLDLDKTTIGARGRNDGVIDRVRLEAAFSTAEHYLGEDFDKDSFGAIYNHFNQVRFHSFTTDNQDYLVYLCLIVSTGFFSQAALTRAVDSGRWASFPAFAAEVAARSGELPPALREMHRMFYERLQGGDPTPFKAFRAFEYQNTVARMGSLDDGSPVEKMLAEEIVLTHEVLQVVMGWKDRGALLLGISDKPDEASVPSEALKKKGSQPIHRVETHVIGA